MDIESVRVLRTLKFGDQVYQGGKVYPQPFSPDILKEIAMGSPYIEIIEKQVEVEPESEETNEKPEEVEIPEKPRKLVRRSG